MVSTVFTLGLGAARGLARGIRAIRKLKLSSIRRAFSGVKKGVAKLGELARAATTKVTKSIERAREAVKRLKPPPPRALAPQRIVQGVARTAGRAARRAGRTLGTEGGRQAALALAPALVPRDSGEEGPSVWHTLAVTAGTVLIGRALGGGGRRRDGGGTRSVGGRTLRRSDIDWSDYPSGVPRPKGPFRVLEGTEYTAARNAANNANRALRAKDAAKYAGKQIHEIHPVKFGGSPTDPTNKIALSPPEHYRLNAFWLRIQRGAQ